MKHILIIENKAGTMIQRTVEADSLVDAISKGLGWVDVENDTFYDDNILTAVHPEEGESWIRPPFDTYIHRYNIPQEWVDDTPTWLPPTWQDAIKNPGIRHDLNVEYIPMWGKLLAPEGQCPVADGHQKGTECFICGRFK